MANVIPTWVAPNVADVLTTQVLRASRIATIPASLNYLRARVHARTVVSQCWSHRMYPTYQRTPVGYAADPDALWRIPTMYDRTEVRVLVLMRTVGGAAAGHSVRLTAVGSGATLDLASPGPIEAWVAGTLTVSTLLSIETIELRAQGDGLLPIEVQSILIRFPDLTGNLPTGPFSDGAGAFDAGEFATDEPLSADSAQAMLATLSGIEAWHQSYCAFSGLANVDTYGIGLQPIAVYLHRVAVPIHGRTVELRVWIYAENIFGGTDATVVVSFTRDGRWAGASLSATITVPAGAFPSWYYTTFDTIPQTRSLGELPREISSAWIGVEPWGSDPTLGARPEGLCDPYPLRILSFCVEGQ
jgi:hypothetical protein